MATLDVYSRRGCHLCEVLIEELLVLASGRVQLQINDIDTHPDWRERYNTRVPVVEFEGSVVCEYRLDSEKVLELLRQLSPSDV